jgi:hypothetical protein
MKLALFAYRTSHEKENTRNTSLRKSNSRQERIHSIQMQPARLRALRRRKAS